MAKQIKIDVLKLTGTVEAVDEGYRRITKGASQVKIGLFEAVYTDKQEMIPKRV